MANIPDLQNAVRRELYNSCRPPEGSLGVPIQIPFTSTAQQWAADLNTLQTGAKINFFQSMFVDNSANTVALTIAPAGLQQTITVPAGWIGYVDILAPNPVGITFTSAVTSNTTITVQLLNFPVNTFLWPTNPLASSGAPYYVSDATLDALLVNGYLPVLNQYLGNGDTVIDGALCTRALTGTITASGATTLLTPSAYYRIGHCDISISGDAAQASAGPLTVQLREGTTAFWRDDPWVPATAGTPAQPQDHHMLDQEWPYWSRTSGATLNINLGAALTDGVIAYAVLYMETATQGP